MPYPLGHRPVRHLNGRYAFGSPHTNRKGIRRCALKNRVLRRLSQKVGIDFAHFGLESDMFYEGNMVRYRIHLFFLYEL